ncbi:acyl-CoA carboxylase subunit epsilon [Nocardioides sp. WG-D5]
MSVRDRVGPPKSPVASGPPCPALRVTSPDAAHVSTDEIAALVAVFSALGTSTSAPREARSAWSTPQLRRPVHPGPGAWRSSALPR